MRRILTLTLLTALAGRPAFALENPGVTAAPVLQIPVGARAVGMGTAFTGVASDVSALYYNPAGLSNLNYRELGVMYLKGVEGQDIEYLAGGTPLPFSGFFGMGYATLGASLLFAQNGEIEVNRTNPDGSLLDSRTLSAGGDRVLSVGYSERVAEFSLDTKSGERTFHHFLGVSGKYIRSSLAETYSATAFGADAGYFVKSPETGLNLGVSVLNFGGRMRFIEEGDPLPLTLRGGLSYFLPLDHLRLPPAQALTFAADGDYLAYERQWHVNAGLEYSVLRRYALRLGYQFHREQLGLTVGFGARWRGLEMDYAWAMTDTFSDTHRFTFTYRFGRVSLQKRSEIRKPFIESLPEREGLKAIEQEKPATLDPPTRPRPEAPEDRRGAPGWIY